MVLWAQATVPDVFDSALQARPDGEALVCGPERLTYRELDQQVDRLATGLAGLGVVRGDRVAIWMVNRTEWLVAYFALARLGAVLVALNTRYTTQECRHILDVAQVKAIIMQDRYRRHDYVAALRELCPEVDAADPGRWTSAALPALREVIVVGDTARGARRYDEVVAAGTRALAGGAAPPREHIDVDDLFLLLFTSGTTSTSKGVMLTHRNIVANNFGSGERQRLTAADRMLFVLPLASAFSCAHGLIAILSHHGTCVLLDSFSAESCLRTIEQERCTTMYGVASMFQDLIELPDRDRFDISTLRTGVGILTPEAAEAIRSELGIPEYHNGWGLTESGGVNTMTTVADPEDIRTGTVGTPLPGVEIKLVDPATGAMVEHGEPGEILIRGAAVSPGYFREPEATAALIDTDGWLHSADLGQLLPGGYLKYLGRLKDVIKTNGFSVAPSEIDSVICLLPGVRAAAVVGVPDPRMMEAVYAFVVRDDSSAGPDDEAVRAHCARHLAGFKVPKYIEFTDGDLPRNELGKLLKRQLREAAIARLAEHAGDLRTPEGLR